MSNWDNLFSSKDPAWRTPQYIFDYYNRIYKFNFDLACSEENMLCPNGFTKEQNSLTQEWHKYKRRAWLNPPYSRKMKQWFDKAVEAQKKGTFVAMLVYARTDTKWWHECVLPNVTSIRFIKGRVKFLDSRTGEEGNSATAPSCLIVFDPIVKSLGRAPQDYYPTIHSDILKEMK